MPDQQTFRVQLPDGQVVEVAAASREDAARAAARFNERRSSQETASQGARFGWSESEVIPQYLRERQIPQAAEAALRQAPTGIESLVPAVGNIAGRLWPGNYEGEGAQQYLPGSGAYNAPLATLEERRQRDVRRTGNPVYNWSATTPEGRVTQAGVGGLAEGVGTGAGVTGARVGLRVGNRALTGALEGAQAGARRQAVGISRNVRPTRGEIENAARDTAHEAVLSGGAAAAGSAVGEAFGPAAGGVAALATSGAGGQISFGRNQAETTARRVLQNFNEADYSRARQYMEEASARGVDLTPVEALAYANPEQGAALLSAYRAGVELRATTDPLQATAIGRLDNFEDAFNAEISRVVGTDPMAGPRSPGVAQREAAEAGQSAIQRARAEVQAAVRPLYDQTQAEVLPQGFLDNFRRNLEARLSGAESARGRAVIREQIDSLENVTSVSGMDEWLQEYRRLLDAGEGERRVAINSANAAIGDEIRLIDQQLLDMSPALQEARALRGQLQRDVIDPIESALGGIANPTARANALGVVRDLVGARSSPEIDPQRLQRGFNAIIDHDPDLAGELVGIHMQDVLARSFRRGPEGARATNAPGRFASELVGDPRSERNLRYMLNELDTARNLERGTTWRSLNTLLETAYAASPRVSYGTSSLAQSAGALQESRRLAGAAAGASLGMLIPLYTQTGRSADEFFRQRAYDRIIQAFTSTDQADIEQLRRLADSPAGSRAVLAVASNIIAPQRAYQSQERNE